MLSLVMIYQSWDTPAKVTVDSALLAFPLDEVVLVRTWNEGKKAPDLKVPTVHADYKCPWAFELDGKSFIGDFARARNFAHGLAHDDWHLTLDVGDLVSSPVKVDLSGLDPAKLYLASYKYSADIRQFRPRLWNSKVPHVRWEGVLHEEVKGDFLEVDTDALAGLDVIHQYADEELSERRNSILLKNYMERANFSEGVSNTVMLSYAAMLALEGEFEWAAAIALNVFHKCPATEDGMRAASLAVSAFKEFDPGSALGAAGSALGFQVENRDAWLLLGRTHLFLGHRREALTCFHQGFSRQASPLVLHSQAVESETLRHYVMLAYEFDLHLSQAMHCVEKEQQQDLLKLVAEELDERRSALYALADLVQYLISHGEGDRARLLVDKVTPCELHAMQAYKDAWKEAQDAPERWSIHGSYDTDASGFITYPGEEEDKTIEHVNEVLERGYEPVQLSQSDRGLRLECLRFQGEAKPIIDIVANGPMTWGPEHLGAMGGSEQAVIHLSRVLAKTYEVHVWAEVIKRETVDRGVIWHRYDSFVPRRDRDAVIVWRDSSEIERIQALSPGLPVIYWPHDVPREKSWREYGKADVILSLSQYHQSLFAQLGATKFHPFRNGIDLTAIERASSSGITRNEHQIIYCSSPTRGLWALLQMWPDILTRVPDAHLVVTYPFDLLDHPRVPREVRRMKGPLVQEIERLNLDIRNSIDFYPRGLAHNLYLEKMRRSSLWVYPTTFPEVSCIVAMEAQALGTWPITTDKGALAETVQGGTVFSSKLFSEDIGFGGDDMTAFPPRVSSRFLEAVIARLEKPPTQGERSNLESTACRSYDWNGAAASLKAAIEQVKEIRQWQPVSPILVRTL